MQFKARFLSTEVTACLSRYSKRSRVSDATRRPPSNLAVLRVMNVNGNKQCQELLACFLCLHSEVNNAALGVLVAQ